MIDFEHDLIAMLERRAASATPEPDLDAVLAEQRNTAGGVDDGRSQQRRKIALIAASVLIVAALGGLIVVTARSGTELRPSSPSDEVVRTMPEVTAPATDNPHFIDFGTCGDRRLFPPWMCAEVEVPVDRADPSQGTITLHVFGIPHSGPDDEAGPPVFTTPDGPGHEGLENYAIWKLPDAVRERHDFITLDPRGTGRRYAIDCPEVQQAPWSGDGYPAAVTACGEQLGATSDDYGAVERALDLEAVREFMGYDEIALHGQGAAGLDVQAYASRYPERVSAVVFDSSFVVDDPDWYMGIGVPGGFLDAVGKACLADAACIASTPDARGVVSATVRALAAEPIVDGDVVVDESEIASLLGSTNDLLPVIDAAAAFVRGDTSPLVELARAAAPSAPDPTRFSVGANVAGWCTDSRPPFDLAASPEARRQQLDAALAAMPDDVFAPWSKQGWAGYWWIGSCLGWPAPAADEPVVPAGTVMPDVPVLILSGELDPIASHSENLLDLFPGADLVRVPGVGISTLSLGDCTAEYEAEFLRTLQTPAGVPCADG